MRGQCLVALARGRRRCIRPGHQHARGTATSWSLTVHSDKPIVVTGAQRPYNALSTDGPIQSRRSGVDVFARVTRQRRGGGVQRRTQRGARCHQDEHLPLQTFRARDLGIIGYAEPGQDRAITARRIGCSTVDSEFNVEGVQSMPYAPSYGIASRRGGSDASARAERTGSRRCRCRLAPGIEIRQETQRGGRAVSPRGRRTRRPQQQLVRARTVRGGHLDSARRALLLSLALLKTANPDEIRAMFDEIETAVWVFGLQSDSGGPADKSRERGGDDARDLACRDGSVSDKRTAPRTTACSRLSETLPSRHARSLASSPPRSRDLSAGPPESDCRPKHPNGCFNTRQTCAEFRRGWRS